MADTRLKDERIHKIFVGGLSQRTKEDALYEYFGTFGPIYKAYLIYDHNTGQSRCFGFVEFNDSYSLDLALSIKTHIIDGRDIECKFVYLKSELEDLENEAPKKCGKKAKCANKNTKKNRSGKCTSDDPTTEHTDQSGSTKKKQWAPKPVKCRAGNKILSCSEESYQENPFNTSQKPKPLKKWGHSGNNGGSQPPVSFHTSGSESHAAPNHGKFPAQSSAGWTSGNEFSESDHENLYYQRMNQMNQRPPGPQVRQPHAPVMKTFHRSRTIEVEKCLGALPCPNHCCDDSGIQRFPSYNPQMGQAWPVNDGHFAQNFNCGPMNMIPSAQNFYPLPMQPLVHPQQHPMPYNYNQWGAGPQYQPIEWAQPEVQTQTIKPPPQLDPIIAQEPCESNLNYPNRDAGLRMVSGDLYNAFAENWQEPFVYPTKEDLAYMNPQVSVDQNYWLDSDQVQAQSGLVS